jgi:transcriptional regulator with XRE-family HTH domain
MNLGRAIKLCRTQRNISQGELATLADVSVSYLSLIERGKRDPNFSTVEKIAKALNVPMSILMFLAADTSEISDISPQLAEKLSYTALKLIEESANEVPNL